MTGIANVGFQEHRGRRPIYLFVETGMGRHEEHAMAAVEPARERIARRLQEAVDRLRRDMDEVEFWSEVLGSLTRPAPDYSDGTDLLNRFILPPQDAERAPQAGGLGPRHHSGKAGNRPFEGPRNRRHSGH
jgi:hypothetical protein